MLAGLLTSHPSKPFDSGRIHLAPANPRSLRPRSADAYHTLYCLSGLSAAQHRVVPNAARRQQLTTSWKDGEGGKFLHSYGQRYRYHL